MNESELAAGLAPTPGYRLIEAHGFGVAILGRLTVYVVGSRQNLGDAWAAVTG